MHTCLDRTNLLFKLFMLNSLLYLIITMKRIGLFMAILANLDSLALVILSASTPTMSDSRAIGIILGVLCWIATAYVIYLSVNEER